MSGDRRRRLKLAGAVLYVVLLATLIGSLYALRHRVLSPDRRAAAQRNWEAWRRQASDQVKRQPGTRRQVPRSPEPPATVLLRDHFGLCLTIAIVFGSALFGSFWFFLYGALTQGSRVS